MRVLALDWGTVRVGAAISDPDGKIAFPLDGYIKAKQAFEEIKKLVDEKRVEKIIIGLPKSLSGENTASTISATEFAEKLKNTFPVSVEMVDERLSSQGASKTLSEQGKNLKQQKDLVDNLAAAQMLQTYLDTK